MSVSSITLDPSLFNLSLCWAFWNVCWHLPFSVAISAPDSRCTSILIRVNVAAYWWVVLALVSPNCSPSVKWLFRIYHTKSTSPCSFKALCNLTPILICSIVIPHTIQHALSAQHSTSHACFWPAWCSFFCSQQPIKILITFQGLAWGLSSMSLSQIYLLILWVSVPR